MNKGKILIYLLLIIFIIVTIFTYEKLKLNIDIKVNNPQVNELLNIDMEIKKYDRYFDVDEVEIEIFNKYKKDEVIKSKITPYEIGKYRFSYLPQYSGKYIINIKMNINNKTYTKSKEVEI